MNQRPLVSIILPTYNRETLLSRSIGSVLKQTYRNWELIIVDDGSTDGTKELIRKYTNKDKRIKYVKNTHKQGPSGARNQGIELSKGKYIAFLDSDDEWLAKKMQIQIDYLSQHPEIEMISSDSWMIDNEYDSRKHRRSKRIKDPVPKKWTKDTLIDQALKGPLWISTPTIMVNKDVFNNVGLFNENLIRGEDAEMWLRINDKHKIGYINKPLTIIHATGILNRTDERYNSYEDKRRLDTFDGYYWLNQFKAIKSRVQLNKKQKKDLNRKLSQIHESISNYHSKSKKLKALYHYSISMYYDYDRVVVKGIKKLFGIIRRV